MRQIATLKNSGINRILGFSFLLTIAVGASMFAGTAIAAGLQLNRDFFAGLAGEDVRSLQKFLNGNGYKAALAVPGSRGSETTRFGLATKAVLTKF